MRMKGKGHIIMMNGDSAGAIKHMKNKKRLVAQQRNASLFSGLRDIIYIPDKLQAHKERKRGAEAPLRSFVHKPSPNLM
jgi:hypothetical protein